MNVEKRLRIQRSGARAPLVLWALWSAACGEPSTVREPSVEGSAGSQTRSETSASVEAAQSICPTCLALTGGESSDFGGTLLPCVSVEEKSTIDATRAAELGFDVPTMGQLIERDIDAPLYWIPRGDGSLRASGFEPETRVQARVTITSYSYVGLNPDACDGFDCLIDNWKWECPDRLELGIEADLSTLDGAMEMNATGYALQGRPGFPFGDRPAGSVLVSPRDVRGTLAVSPENGLHDVVIATSFYFEPGGIEGDILLGFSSSSPLWGTWPNPYVPPTGLDQADVEDVDGEAGTD